MSELTLKTAMVSRKIEQVRVPVLDVQVGDDSPTMQSRIPLTARVRQKVLRVAPPIDDGFRPFRVF
jgi:hypothetical protein